MSDEDKAEMERQRKYSGWPPPKDEAVKPEPKSKKQKHVEPKDEDGEV